jgi:CBS domain-containing protein
MDIGSDLRNETVRQVGPLPPLCIEPERPTRSALEMLRDLGRGAVLVCRQGVLVGIFTERDALRVLASGGIHWLVDHFPSAGYNLPPVAKPGTLQREGP